MKSGYSIETVTMLQDKFRPARLCLDGVYPDRAGQLVARVEIRAGKSG
jgi:hypothetical protein